MPTKRIVPFSRELDETKFVFADGERYLPEWERKYLDDSIIQEVTKETMGVAKTLRELTYLEWVEKVYNAMEMRGRFTGEVEKLMSSHFRTYG